MYKVFVSYLPTDYAAPATAVLAFIDGLVAAAQRIKSQDSSHTVPDEAHLNRPMGRQVNKTISIFLPQIHKVQTCYY